MKKLLGLLALLITLGVGYQAGRGQSPPRPVDPLPVPLASATPERTRLPTVTAEVRNLSDRLDTSGNLTADPDLQSQVGAPIGGRVVKLFATVGDRVRTGQPLALMKSPEVTKALAEQHHAELRFELAKRTMEQRRQLMQLGDASRRPVEEARNEYALGAGEQDVTRSALELAAKKWRRVRDLHEHGISTLQEVEEAQSAYEQAQARYRQATRQLKVAVGHRKREEQVAASGLLVAPKMLEAETELLVAQEEVEHTKEILNDLGLTGDHGEEGLLLRAPRDGILVERKVTLGQAVSADQDMFVLLDSSRLCLWIYLYEQDLSAVRVGMRVRLSVKAFPDKTFSGKISYMTPELQVGSRTTQALVLVDNQAGLLKTGMFCNVRIFLGAVRQGVTVPQGCIVRDGHRQLVYVEESDQKFVPHEVEIGQENRKAGWVEIRRGLRAGTRVVSDGAYYLHKSRQEESP